MPTSVYSLLFKDPELKKLDPCNMKIRTYTKDAVKIVGSANSTQFTQTLKTTGSDILFCEE